MGFQSPALDLAEQILTIASLYGNDDNCRTIETSAGYVIINIAREPKIGDTILIASAVVWTSQKFRGGH